jgi:hypothetical protein
MGDEYMSFIHPDDPKSEPMGSPCFLSLDDAELFLRGFFNGNPDMCVIVDGEPNNNIEDR